jgi:hypothetical protein
MVADAVEMVAQNTTPTAIGRVARRLSMART